MDLYLIFVLFEQIFKRVFKGHCASKVVAILPWSLTCRKSLKSTTPCRDGSNALPPLHAHARPLLFLFFNFFSLRCFPPKYKRQFLHARMTDSVTKCVNFCPFLRYFCGKKVTLTTKESLRPDWGLNLT